MAKMPASLQHPAQLSSLPQVSLIWGDLSLFLISLGLFSSNNWVCKSSNNLSQYHPQDKHKIGGRERWMNEQMNEFSREFWQKKKKKSDTQIIFFNFVQCE